jgi:hypothetical protein
LSSYQDTDQEIIDYELFRLPGIVRRLRGPEPADLSARSYFTCVGAAQTFGRFCNGPYPWLLASDLGVSALNFGIAGAGPRFFLEREGFLSYVNKGRFAIVQVMSARSEDNSMFESSGLEYVTRRSDGTQIGAAPAYAHLLTNDTAKTVEVVVEETRANWVKSFTSLLQAIEVPKILFWFSKRSPEYEETYSDVNALFGEFPQLVNEGMVEQLKPLSDEYVECVTTRGSPQPLLNRFTGDRASVVDRADLGGVRYESNSYYPSPEMHIDASNALVEVCRIRAGE